MKSAKSLLEESLLRLELSAKKIVETRGYTREVEKIKILEELIKEQLINENTRSAARSLR